jgi:hypothetical protein
LKTEIDDLKSTFDRVSSKELLSSITAAQTQLDNAKIKQKVRKI